MGIFRNDPSPFIGGRQPLEGRKMNPSLFVAAVDAPPLRKASLLLSVVLAAWVPPDPPPFMGGQQPLDARTLPPQITAVPVDNPPFVHRGRTAAIVQQTAALCQPDPWTFTFLGRQGRLQPYAPAKLPPSLIIVPEPPHTHPGRQPVQSQQAAIAAQPPDWTYAFLGQQGRLQPYGPPHLPPSLIIVPEPPHAHPQRQPQNIQQAAIAAQPPDWPYTFMGGNAPYDQRNLNPKFEGIDNPPFSGADEAENNNVTILAAWRFPDPPPTLTVKRIQPFVASASIPNTGSALTVIIQSWQQPDPLPTLARKLPPSVTAVAVNDPSGAAIPRIVLADPPPLPQQNKKIAALLATVSAQTPYARPIANIIASWQPPDPPSQQLRQLAPGIPGQSVDPPPLRKPQSQAWAFTGDISFITGPQGAPASVDNPPFGAFCSTLNIVPIWWRPPDPLPTLSNKLPPQITAVRVDNPPFSIRLPIHWPLWQTIDPLPSLGAKLVQSGAAVVVSNPSGSMVLRIVVVPPPPLPQQSMKIAAILAVAATNDPPFTHRERFQAQLQGSVAQSQPDGWVYSFQGGRQPYEPLRLNAGLLGVRVDNPPFTHRGRAVVAATITTMAQPPDPPPFMGGRQPIEPRKLNPATLDVSVNNPPFGSRTHLPNILRSWEDPAPLPWFHNLYVQPLAVTYVPYTQVWLPGVLRSWIDPDRPPEPQRKLSPGIPGQSVDNPPRLRRVDVPYWDDPRLPQVPRPYARVETTGQPFIQQGTATAILLWQPQDFRIEPQRKVPPALLQPVNNPPFSHRGRLAYLVNVALAWQSPDPLPTLRTRLPPSVTAVPVNNPPFDMRGHALPSIIQMWQPEPFVFRPPYVPTARSIQPFLGVRIIAKPTLIGQKIPQNLKGQDATPSLSGQEIATTLKGKVEN